MPLSPWVPDLPALELLASVAMTGSFGRAAQEHGISQPAVSSRIRHLERRLGLPLVERSTRGSKLTAEGAMVVEWARALLDTAGQLEAGVAALRRSREGKLRVAASLTIAEYLMPAWLVAVSRDHTEIEVSLGVGNSVEVERRVLGDEADIGFVETPTVPATLTSRVVGRDHLSVVVAPAHPWARRRRPITATELARTALVQREDGSGTRETYAQALDRLGLD
ncbi:MAG: LysR family transcriptional regulator, partial [Nocardioidaceae bacterium]